MSKQNSKQKHLLIVNYIYDARFKNEFELISSYIQMHMWAKGCCANGIKVTVMQRFHSDRELVQDDIQYFFFNDRKKPFIKFYDTTRKFNQRIKLRAGQLINAGDDVAIHINGMIFPVTVFHLSSILDARIKIALQNHAENPRNPVKKIIYQFCFRKIEKYIFTTMFHAEPWVKAKILDRNEVYEIMECTSACTPGDKDVAKEKLGFKGDVLILWTGNLNLNKDPVTILFGFKSLLLKKPNAKLYMLYKEDTLEELVRHKCFELGISEQVCMVGEIKYTDIDDYYNAADIFVQGSCHEGSGIAVLDAMCCGAVPVVTRIPSFEKILKGLGELWERGDKEDFGEKLAGAVTEKLEMKQVLCREAFQRHWSDVAIGERAKQCYFPEVNCLS